MLVAGENVVDCSTAVAAQSGDSALVNSSTDDCTTGSTQSKTGKVTVCVKLFIS